MSKVLIEKLRRSREINVDVDGKKYTVQRPTDADFVELGTANNLEFIRRFVVGWELREMDLVPGGGPDAVPFDRELWSVWVADQPQLWGPLADAMLDAYRKHSEARSAAEKN